MVPLPQIGWYSSQNWVHPVPIKQMFSSGFGEMKNVRWRSGGAIRKSSTIMFTLRPTTGKARRNPNTLCKNYIRMIIPNQKQMISSLTDQGEKQLFH